MNARKPQHFMIAFAVIMCLFVIANLIAVHLRSDAGLLEGLGIVDRTYDDIRRIGFPFQFLEEGGDVHRKIFNPVALGLDLFLAAGCATGAAFAFSRFRRRVGDEKV